VCRYVFVTLIFSIKFVLVLNRIIIFQDQTVTTVTMANVDELFSVFEDDAGSSAQATPCDAAIAYDIFQ